MTDNDIQPAAAASKRPSFKFSPGLTDVVYEKASITQRSFITTVPFLDQSPEGQHLKERIAELFSPSLFSPKIHALGNAHDNLRDMLHRNGCSLPQHSCRLIVDTLAHILYDEALE